MAARVRPDSRDNLQELVLTQGDAAAMASVAQALQGALTNTRLAALPLALSRNDRSASALTYASSGAPGPWIARLVTSWVPSLPPPCRR